MVIDQWFGLLGTIQLVATAKWQMNANGPMIRWSTYLTRLSSVHMSVEWEEIYILHMIKCTWNLLWKVKADTAGKMELLKAGARDDLIKGVCYLARNRPYNGAIKVRGTGRDCSTWCTSRPLMSHDNNVLSCPTWPISPLHLPYISPTTPTLFTCHCSHEFPHVITHLQDNQHISLSSFLCSNMGRAPCCENVGLKKGRWTAEEDEILTRYIQENGEGSWRSLPKKAGREMWFLLQVQRGVFFSLSLIFVQNPTLVRWVFSSTQFTQRHGSWNNVATANVIWCLELE